MLVIDTSTRVLLQSPSFSHGAAAVLDTLLGHGVVAGVQFYCAALLSGTSHALELGLLCGLASAGMDVDHFLSAGSLSLSAAMALPTRPFAHSLLFLAATLAAALALARLHLLPVWAPHLLAVAFGGHQLRDSIKRGLWLAPMLGSTPPTPYLVYLLAMACAPLALAPVLKAALQQPLLPL